MSLPEQSSLTPGSSGPDELSDAGQNAAAWADQLVHQIQDDLPAGRLGIAYSGGVDSAVLCAGALRALGADRVVALLGVSASLAQRERDLAHSTADQIGVRCEEIATHEGEVEGYRANGADRCYWCKNELFTVIDDQLVSQFDLVGVAYGENADDQRRPDRPGSQAATQHRVLRPLAEAGLTKAQVRAIARHWGIQVAEKPAAPCLASRIPHGQEVTADKLRQIEQAEDAVLAEGFSDVRVRHHGDVARIEVPEQELARLIEKDCRARVVAGVRKAGFRFVTVDLGGIQSGAFTLPLVQVNHG